jgi:hypothetical protein
MNLKQNPTQHPTEEALIAFHLGEAPDTKQIAAHLDLCQACTEVSESIAETLRVFSADPVPQPNLDHHWQCLRGSLAPIAVRRKSRFRPDFWRIALWPAAAVAISLAVVLALTYTPVQKQMGDIAVWHRPGTKTGPLTVQPRNPDIANQIDAAERLLTVVNHTTGPLDDETRAQAHQLLLRNALYVRTARDEGDYGTAAILDNFGRVLTDIDHRAPTPDSTWHLRFEWNTQGLLLDLRILRQNETKQ